MFFKTENPYDSLIKFAKSRLKENGKILIAMDNKFGIKYFSGAKSEHYDSPFNSIIGQDGMTSKMLSKVEIEKILKENDLNNYKFYYPLPDYKIPNVFFSDEYIPNKNTSKLVYDAYYLDGSKVVFNEVSAIKEITDKNEFKNFANSFFIEIALNKDDELSKTKFISYNNSRKINYNLMLKIEENKVIKETISEEAKQHIQKIARNIETLKQLGFEINENYNDGKIESDFETAETFDKFLLRILQTEGKDRMYEEINKWYSYVYNKLINSEVKEKLLVYDKLKVDIKVSVADKLHFIKNGFIDLVFENTFIDNEKYKFFDQEWYIENVPIEFILYRAISNFTSYYQEKNMPSKEEMFEKFEIIDFMQEFQKIEKHFQEEVLDKATIKRTEHSKNMIYDINN